MSQAWGGSSRGSTRGNGSLATADIPKEKPRGESQLSRIDSIENTNALALLCGIRFNDTKFFEPHKMAGNSAVVRSQGPSNLAGCYSFGMQGEVPKNFCPQRRQAKKFYHFRHLLRRLGVGVNILRHSPILPKNNDGLFTVSLNGTVTVKQARSSQPRE